MKSALLVSKPTTNRLRADGNITSVNSPKFCLLAVVALLLCVGAASAQTGISGCTTITKAGTYMLTADIDGTSCGTDAILISASNVKLSMQGHTITVAQFAFGSNTSGIHLASGTKNVTILGPGTVNASSAGPGFQGIFVDGAQHSTVVSVTLTGNELGIYQATSAASVVPSFNVFSVNRLNGNVTDGLRFANSLSSQVIGNLCQNNGSNGITVISGQSDVIEGNQCTGNYNVGIAIAESNGTFAGNVADNNLRGIAAEADSGNKITRNEASGNPGYDMVENNSTCTNKWTNNVFGTANQSCIH